MLSFTLDLLKTKALCDSEYGAAEPRLYFNIGYSPYYKDW